MSIGDVLSLLAEEHPDLTVSKIRFLEAQGLISPQRTPSGYRKFYDSDVKRLNWVLIQQRDNFLPLKEIKRRLTSGAVAKTSPRRLAGEPASELAALSLFEPLAGSESSRADLAASSSASAASAESAASAASGEENAEAASASSDAAVAASGRDVPPTPAPDRPRAPGRLTVEQLAQQLDADLDYVVELKRHGIIAAVGESRDTGSETVLQPEALALAETAAALAEHGIPARNLRMFKVAADREAGVYEQLLAPLIARGDRDLFLAELTEIIDLAERLRRLLLLQAIRSYLS